jgi:predicted site-specific integrase-resolvase
LPFSPKFKHKNRIEAKFEEEDYRVITLELTIHGNKEQLFRPYDNAIFTHRSGFGPKFFYVKNKLGKGKLGFAWVCLNDARKYLPEKNLRGLLIKKFGFSVGGRDAFTKFFSRAVFNNRITGEVIVTDEQLLPNAARTEFEPSKIRDSLYMGFAEMAAEISSWANGIQDELKAKEELQSISPLVFSILKAVPSNDRDIATLLRFNTSLDWYERRIGIYKRILEEQQKDLLDRTLNALNQAKSNIKKILASRKEDSEEKRKRRVKIGTVQKAAPVKKELVYAKDKPKNVLEAISLMDIDVNKDILKLIEYLDQEVIRHKLPEGEYSEFLEDLVEYLEENL